MNNEPDGKEKQTCVYCGFLGEMEYRDFIVEHGPACREYICPRCRAPFVKRRADDEN